MKMKDKDVRDIMSMMVMRNDIVITELQSMIEEDQGFLMHQ